jgi:2-oxoglutarate ferredoxin oxidoreductase subunit alpha
LAKDAIVFADNFSEEDDSILKERAAKLPMAETGNNLSAPPITKSSVALGATCYLLDLRFAEMQKILEKVFKEKSYKINIELADLGFRMMEMKKIRHPRTQINADGNARINANKILVEGNTAFAKGLQSAGLDFYLAYPMTPSTSILHYLANEQINSKLRVIQPESELSVINMALGIAYAGKRVAIGSATGGFALMQETFSFAGIAELPIAIAVSQRQAPATGAPTFSSQTDLKFMINSGHGEFPRIIIAPGDPEETFYAGATALNLAWKFQIPTIILMDKILSEHQTTSIIDKSKITIEKGNIAEKIEGGYERYKITENGISPMAFPGTANATVKITSYEHDQFGITTEEQKEVKAMIDKRFAKTKSILEEMNKIQENQAYYEHV